MLANGLYLIELVLLEGRHVQPKSEQPISTLSGSTEQDPSHLHHSAQNCEKCVETILLEAPKS